MEHMATRLTWTDPGFNMEVYPSDTPIEKLRAAAADADVFVVLGVQEDGPAERIAMVLEGVPTGTALGWGLPDTSTALASPRHQIPSRAIK